MSQNQSEVGRITRLGLKHVKEAFISDEAIAAQWRGLNYEAAPDFQAAVTEYDAFVELLQGLGIGLSYMPSDPEVGLDSIYVRDAAVLAADGIILGNMGKAQRGREPAAQARFFRDNGIQLIGSIEAPGKLEGGDLVWLSQDTVAVGCGYRTNGEGILQLRELLGGRIQKLITVDLPHWRGPADVFHLMSIISPVDRDLALVYSPLMPVSFRQWLLHNGVDLIEVPEAEFSSLGCNVLTIAPRKCIALAGNPLTKKRLEAFGVEVFEYLGNEISLKGQGGPTCLTRPIERERANAQS